MKILEGTSVADSIKSTFEERLNNLKTIPHIAVLVNSEDAVSGVYVKRIQKNCIQYGIKMTLLISKTDEEFKENFYKVKNDETITGIMFQQPLSNELMNLINELPSSKDVEGIGAENMGKLMLGDKSALIPCTSRAVIKTLEYYNIDLTGKKVVLVGRSKIVGKPLIPQLLEKNATLTICHTKTKDLEKETGQADVIIMATGNSRFLKDYHIKDNAIIIDVGINFDDGKIVGDVDFESIKEKASMCTPVPGGIGVITNALLIDNIIKACENMQIAN